MHEAIVLDSRIARDCPRGARPASLGDRVGNLSVLILSLYGMVDAVIGTFTVPALKVLVRTLRRMGFSATVLTGRKSEIAESVREAATGHMVTLDLTGSMPPLTDELVQEFAHFGLLGPTPGARAIITNDHGGRRLVYDDDMLIQDGISPDASDLKQWVNSCYDATIDPTTTDTHRVKRGVMQSGDRFTCNRNQAWLDGEVRVPGCTTRGGIPSCVPGQGRDAEATTSQIVGGFCPVCGGRADTPILRQGVSTLNARFVNAIIVRPNGTIACGVRRYPRHESVDVLRQPLRAKQCITRHGTLYTRCQAEEGEPGVDGFGYVEVEVQEWIGPEPRPVHTQKVGGRHAMKVNGRTEWASGSFVRVLVPTVSFGDLLCWAFFCNHDADDRRRYPDYDPARLNRAAAAVVKAAARAGVPTAQEVSERIGGAL